MNMKKKMTSKSNPEYFLIFTQTDIKFVQFV